MGYGTRASIFQQSYSKPAIMLSMIIGLGALCSPASAQTAAAQEETPDFLADLKTCKDITDNERRLACYDASVGAVVEASDAGEVQIVDQEEVQSTRRGLFGFTLPKNGLFGNDNNDGELRTLESTITRVRGLARNSYIITIDEGSVWRINNAPSRLRPPRSGDEVVLKKAALGSYFIRIAGQTGVKGRRVE